MQDNINPPLEPEAEPTNLLEDELGGPNPPLEEQDVNPPLDSVSTPSGSGLDELGNPPLEEIKEGGQRLLNLTLESGHTDIGITNPPLEESDEAN